MPDHRDVRHTGKQIRPGEVRPQVRTGQVRPARQRGAASLEFWVVCLALLPLVLGSFQGVLLYNAKSVLNQATFEAARIGAVQHAQVAPMQAELARRLAGFYGPTNSAQAYPQAYAKALTDITTPVTPDQRVGSGTTIRILNPTREAFNDFGEDLDGKRQIPNHHLKRRDTAVGPTSSVNIQDANLLKLEVTYGYRMTVPIAAPLIAAVMQIADPAHAAYYQASPPRLPLKASALVRLHSPAWLSAANVSVSAALNPGGAGGIGDGQGYQPLPGIGTGGIDGAPDDTDPNAGYQPGDHTPIDTSPPDEGEVDGEGEGDGEGTAGEPYKCMEPGTTWAEAGAIITSGTATQRITLARDLLLAAVEGFGDQVVDIGNLVADIASGAWEVANEIVDDPLAWFKGKLESAVSTLEKGLEMMRNIDQVIKGLQDLWTNHQKYIDELKNGIGQELYNQYVAPIECGPIDTMRLITQNVSPAAPARVVVVFNKLRAVMKLPELPTNPKDPDGPDGGNNPNDGKGNGDGTDPDGNGNHPNAPNGLVAGKDRDGDGRDDDSGIVCDISGGPARSSFVAGTPVLTPEGLKPIESLKAGDLVQSRSDVDFSEQPQRITQTFHRIAPGYWHLRLESKRYLDVTEEHPIWQQGKGWVETRHYEEMKPAAAWGDDLMITHKTWVEGPVPVFNFSVENTPSYFAGQDSLWVHNASGDCSYQPQYTGLDPQRAQYFRDEIHNATAAGNLAKANDLRWQRYKENKEALGENPGDEASYKDKLQRLQNNQKRGIEMEGKSRDALKDHYGELHNNNVGEGVKKTDSNKEVGDSPDRETTSRPDSVNDSIVHEHKHLMVGEGDQVIYNTQQIRLQKEWAKDHQKEHVLTISSDAGYGPDGLPKPRPSDPLANGSKIHYVDPQTGQVTHTWREADTDRGISAGWGDPDFTPASGARQ
jgi:hypothetical protein